MPPCSPPSSSLRSWPVQSSACCAPSGLKTGPRRCCRRPPLGITFVILGMPSGGRAATLSADGLSPVWPSAQLATSCSSANRTFDVGLVAFLLGHALYVAGFHAALPVGRWSLLILAPLLTRQWRSCSLAMAAPRSSPFFGPRLCRRHLGHGVGRCLSIHRRCPALDRGRRRPPLLPVGPGCCPAAVCSAVLYQPSVRSPDLLPRPTPPCLDHRGTLASRSPGVFS